MLRALLMIILLVVVVGLILVWTGFIELSRNPAPQQGADYEVQVNPPEVGTTNIQVPVIRPADDAAVNGAAPAPAPGPAPVNAQ